MRAVWETEEFVDGWKDHIKSLLGKQTPDEKGADAKDQAESALDHAQVSTVWDCCWDWVVGRV